MGRIADGSTVSDYHVSEKQRQISVQTSLLRAEWMGKKFNILDTPGYLDFISEALSALARGRFRAGGRSCAARHRRRHGAGLELRHGIRHSKNDRRQRHGQTQFALRRSAGRGAEHFGSGCFPHEPADQCRPRLQPGAGRAAQRNCHLRLADGRGKFTEDAGHRRVGGAGQKIAHAN